MMLKVEKINQDIVKLQSKKKAAQLIIERNETIQKDIQDANMEEYYDT